MFRLPEVMIRIKIWHQHMVLCYMYMLRDWNESEFSNFVLTDEIPRKSYSPNTVIVILFLLIFSLFIASLIQPKAWSVYLGSVVIGYGASGNFLCLYLNMMKTRWRYSVLLSALWIYKGWTIVFLRHDWYLVLH